ncbi:DNA repair protein RadA, partial [Staphylococcus pseudintermedius]|nr:DNA repair protein RadA [Staphylococcus pseudintermedius]
MAKTKTIFECTACGYQSPKWMGKCPNCGAWNSMEESFEQKTASPKHGVRAQKTSSAKIQKLDDIKQELAPRIQT